MIRKICVLVIFLSVISCKTHEKALINEPFISKESSDCIIQQIIPRLKIKVADSFYTDQNKVGWVPLKFPNFAGGKDRFLKYLYVNTRIPYEFKNDTISR